MITSAAEIPSSEWMSTGIPRPLSLMVILPSLLTFMRISLAKPAITSSIELSKISSFEKRPFGLLANKVPHIDRLSTLILLPIIVPLVIVQLLYLFVIRGVYYAGRSLVNSVTSLFKNTPKKDDIYVITPEEEPQNTVDDLSCFMASKASKEQTVNMHNTAGVLFNDLRLLELKTSASDIGLFSKKAKDDVDLVAQAESYAFQP